MPITKEQPINRGHDASDDDDDRGLFEPVTDAPKLSKREQWMQRKREKAGLGLMQLIGWGAGMLGKFKLLPVLPEDVAAVAIHARPIAKSLADTAQEDERFAAVFDRLTDLGPYGAIIEAVSPLIVQIVANHKKEIRNNPVLAEQMGVIPPDELLAMMTDGRPNQASENGDGNSI